MANKYRVLHGLHREGNRVYRGAYKTKKSRVINGVIKEDIVEIEGEVVDSACDLSKQNFPDSVKFERVPDSTKVSPGKVVDTPQVRDSSAPSSGEAKPALKPVKS